MKKIGRKRIWEWIRYWFLIRPACFISMYNSMNKNKAMEAMDFSWASLPDRGHKELISLPNCFLMVAAHYGTETWAQLSPLFWASMLHGKGRWSELKGYTEECVALSLSAISSLMC